MSMADGQTPKRVYALNGEVTSHREGTPSQPLAR